jgi:hypothetical protein
VVSRALSAIARSSGPGAAKTARACLSGMFALVIRNGAAACWRSSRVVGPLRPRQAEQLWGSSHLHQVDEN